MIIRQRLAAALATVFLLSGCVPVFTVNAEQPPVKTNVETDSTKVPDENLEDETTETAPEETTETIAEIEATEPASEETAETIAEIETEGTSPREADEEASSEPTVGTPPLETAEAPEETAQEDESAYPVPDEPPAFHARIERGSTGYKVKGTFMDFTPDITQIHKLYSLDGENWRRLENDAEWNLCNLGTEDESKRYELQNQVCLNEGYEPLKSYVAGKIDHFYLKLCITRQNGLSYESQSAVIERSGLQPIPEGTECTAYFSPAMTAREPNPEFPRLPVKHGRYQLTVTENATVEDVYTLLPDTLPIKVELTRGSNPYASDTVDCPVTWKPLSLPALSAGERITLSDAAEKIFVPAGTQLTTPLGMFVLDEMLSLYTSERYYQFDNVELVINVIPGDFRPDGVLRRGLNGLEIALNPKPVGATGIQAYVLTEGESKWTELTGLSLLKELNAQPATDSSGYGLVLRNDQEPYQSYLESTAAGVTPTPFFVGLKIEGGIHDGRQLILAWPDIYETLPDLPDVGGSEGNEGNAGAGNKGDSTEGGQRPNLPQTSDDSISDGESIDDDNREEHLTPVAATPDDSGPEPQPEPANAPETVSAIPENPNASPNATASDSGQRPELPHIAQNTADTSSATPSIPSSQDPSRTDEWFDSSAQASLVALAATDDQNEERAVTLSNAETAIILSADSSSRTLLLPVTIAVAAGSCIGAAACKVTGFHLFRHISRLFRTVLRQ